MHEDGSVEEVSPVFILECSDLEKAPHELPPDLQSDLLHNSVSYVDDE